MNRRVWRDSSVLRCVLANGTGRAGPAWMGEAGCHRNAPVAAVYIGENEPIVPDVGTPLPVIVLSPRVWTVEAFA